MRRIMNSVWLLGSIMAMSAALVVTLAHAAPSSGDSRLRLALIER